MRSVRHRTLRGFHACRLGDRRGRGGASPGGGTQRSGALCAAVDTVLPLYVVGTDDDGAIEAYLTALILNAPLTEGIVVGVTV
jgi:hypothetical protein